MQPFDIFRRISAVFKPSTILIVWYIATIMYHNTLLVCGDIWSFQQHDYVVEYNHIHAEFSDPIFVESFHLKNVKPNRTYKAFAMTFHLLTDIKDNGKFKINLKGFRLLNNGLDHLIFQFNIDVCQALQKNIFGMMQIIRAGNITTCPIKKGYYYANNFIVDDKKMPPNIPEGRYKVLITIIDDSKPMASASLYMDIIYKIKD